MNKNIIAATMSGISSLGLLGIALWGGNIIISIVGLVSLLGAFLLYKDNGAGKWICLASISTQLLFVIKGVIEMIRENNINSYESWVWFAGIFFLGIPLIYLITTLVFVIRSKPTKSL